MDEQPCQAAWQDAALFSRAMGHPNGQQGENTVERPQQLCHLSIMHAVCSVASQWQRQTQPLGNVTSAQNILETQCSSHFGHALQEAGKRDHDGDSIVKRLSRLWLHVLHGTKTFHQSTKPLRKTLKCTVLHGNVCQSSLTSGERATFGQRKVDAFVCREDRTSILSAVCKKIILFTLGASLPIKYCRKSPTAAPQRLL